MGVWRARKEVEEEGEGGEQRNMYSPIKTILKVYFLQDIRFNIRKIYNYIYIRYVIIYNDNIMGTLILTHSRELCSYTQVLRGTTTSPSGGLL